MKVLDVCKDGLMLYWVDDSLFTARIEGNTLSAPKLVVEGKDVPEVHWVFWPKARTEPHSNAHTSRKH